MLCAIDTSQAFGKLVRLTGYLNGSGFPEEFSYCYAKLNCQLTAKGSENLPINVFIGSKLGGTISYRMDPYSAF